VADGLITREPPATRRLSLGSWRDVVARYRLMPWWAKVLAVFVLSRVISTAYLVGFARIQATNYWTVQSPGYFDFAKIWDGTWYWIIEQQGYPSVLSVVDGHVGQNAWAFMPVYPMVIKVFMLLTGASFGVVAVCVSVAAAAGTSLLLYRLLRTTLPGETALFGVVVFCVSPLSPLLQVAYAESLFLLLLCAALLLLVQRRYWAMVPVTAVAAFTRPGVVALSLALVLHFGYRWWHRRSSPFPARERVTVVVVAGVTGILGFAWPLVAAIVTGDLHAYTDTELSWRADYIGYGALVPFAPWIDGANWWFPHGAGLIYLVVLVVLFAGFLISPWARRIPVDLRLWSAAYAVYLLAVFFPQSSTFRILMPMFPLVGALAVPRSKVYRLALVVVLVGLQWVWLYYCWWVNGLDWTPP